MLTDEQTSPLHHHIREIILSARSLAARSVDTVQVSMNYAIGQRIVEHEQQGEQRAAYGKRVLVSLAKALSAEFGRGFSTTNLSLMRQFYMVYSPRIGQSVSDLFQPQPIHQTASDKFPPLPIHQTLSDELVLPSITTPAGQATPTKSSPFAPVSWSHYVELMRLPNPDERAFYELESASQGWDVRTLKRQISACLYERLALSTDKEQVRQLSEQGNMPASPRQLIKDPLVLEFLGLEQRPSYSERDLESAIIDQLETFLLELGKGFLFEARQKRFTFGTDHFFVDLVFYNRLLRCYVLIDLKIGKLTHENLGQMQMYVNYFDRHVKLPDENPSVGIILCKDKHDALVELTLPQDANIYASRYQLYLPSKEELQQKLRDWISDGDDSSASD